MRSFDGVFFRQIDKSEPPYPGEVIYKDDDGAICCCWNWKESVRTLLTEKTKNAFLCIESVDEKSNERFENALKTLKTLVEKYLYGNCSIHILDINNKSIIIKD